MEHAMQTLRGNYFLKEEGKKKKKTTTCNLAKCKIEWETDWGQISITAHLMHPEPQCSHQRFGITDTFLDVPG